MKLDPNLAQSIVDKMMASIPYNINMMNEKGYIIASGNKERINTLHLGAIDIIKSGKTKPMAESFGKFGQPGVNIPIEFGGKTIGVVGITGDPKKVTPLAALLKISTELLISQINHNKIESHHKETLNRFLYQWTNIDDIRKSEDLKLQAQSLNINLSLSRYVILIQTKNKNSLSIHANDFHFDKSSDRILIITKSETNISDYLRYCQTNNLPIGISNKIYNLKTAVQQAADTIKVSKILNLQDTHYFEQISLFNNILNSNLHSVKALDVFKDFLKTNSRKELLDTLDCYFKNDGNVTKTSNDLNVHRNTTNYRLKNIAEYFDLNIHNLTDVLQLYINYLYFKKYQYEHAQ